MLVRGCSLDATQAQPQAACASDTSNTRHAQVYQISTVISVRIFIFRKYLQPVTPVILFLQGASMEISQDRSVQVMQTEKSTEYEKSFGSLQVERDMVNLEGRKRNKRKTPRPGCYPLGFSEYTMQGVPCTLALNELRMDLSKCSALPASASIYFDEVGPVECSQSTAKPLVVKHTKPQFAGERLSRRKISHEEHLRPRSAAEERRQLEAVLKQSMVECGNGRSHVETQAQPNKSTVIPSHASLSDVFNSHQRSMFAAQILCGLD
jgi:hypothetical protein